MRSDFVAYKEIVTKAVIGKGKKTYKNTYSIPTTDTPTTVLGCWIINHNFNAYDENDDIIINGGFDVNIWYSYDNDTKTTVINKPINYTEKETLNIENKDITNKSVIVRALKQPNCIKATIDDKNINIEVEKELGIEIVGDTKVKINVEDDYDDYEEVFDEITDEEINNIDETYLNDESDSE